jgi:tetratricopeptide (TPR) repeat protein
MTAQPSDFADCEQQWGLERCIAGCTRIIEDPTVPISSRLWALTRRAISYGTRVEYDRALDELEIAIPLEPINGYIYFLRALLHVARHDPDMAIEDLTQAIRLGYDSAMVFSKRAEAYRDRRDFESAIADFT